MKLTIDNFAKVGHAVLDLNGITLIAGDNDSGKSTCGKAVASLLTAFSSIDERVRRVRIERLIEALASVLNRRPPIWGDDFVEKFLDGKMPTADFLGALGKYVRLREYGETKKSELASAVEEVRDLDDIQVRRIAILRTFDSVFHGQYLPLFKSGKEKRGDTSVSLEADQRKWSVVLKKNICEYVCESASECRAWFVDDPSVVDLFGERYFLRAKNMFEAQLVHAVNDDRRDAVVDPVRGAFDAAMSKKSLAAIANQFKKIGDDVLVSDKDAGYVIKRKELSAKLVLSNASMGTKSLALLRILVERGIVRKGDLLILDEPEIHLHPQWQLIYAELIVLLRKELGVFVLLTTHSPDFIQAIRVYSRLHGIGADVTAYLTAGEQATTVKKVKDEDWDSLFDRYMPTVKLLEKLTDEVEA